jgi:hypothetical protein
MKTKNKKLSKIPDPCCLSRLLALALQSPGLSYKIRKTLPKPLNGKKCYGECSGTGEDYNGCDRKVNVRNSGHPFRQGALAIVLFPENYVDNSDEELRRSWGLTCKHKLVTLTEQHSLLDGSVVELLRTYPRNPLIECYDTCRGTGRDYATCPYATPAYLSDVENNGPLSEGYNHLPVIEKEREKKKRQRLKK